MIIIDRFINWLKEVTFWKQVITCIKRINFYFKVVKQKEKLISIYSLRIKSILTSFGQQIYSKSISSSLFYLKNFYRYWIKQVTDAIHWKKTKVLITAYDKNQLVDKAKNFFSQNNKEFKLRSILLCFIVLLQLSESFNEFKCYKIVI